MEKYRKKGVKFAAGVIAEVDEFGMSGLLLEADVEKFIEDTGISFPVYMDGMDALRYDYSVDTVPLLAFINAEGKLMYSRPFTYADDISTILDAVINEESIDVSGMQTKAG